MKNIYEITEELAPAFRTFVSHAGTKSLTSDLMRSIQTHFHYDSFESVQDFLAFLRSHPNRVEALRELFSGTGERNHNINRAVNILKLMLAVVEVTREREPLRRKALV